MVSLIGMGNKGLKQEKDMERFIHNRVPDTLPYRTLVKFRPVLTDRSGQVRHIKIINELIVSSLALRSRQLIAKECKRWALPLGHADFKP